MDRIQLWTLAENLDPMESPITHPVTMTHDDADDLIAVLAGRSRHRKRRVGACAAVPGKLPAPKYHDLIQSELHGSGAVMTGRGLVGRRSAPVFDADAILREVLGLYDSALDGDVVVDALDRLAPLFGARMGALIRIDRVGGTMVGSHFCGGEAATPTVHEYTPQDLGDDYLYNATRALPPGATYLGSEVLGSDVLRRSPIYHRLMAPKAIEFVVGGLLENSSETYSALGFWRSGSLGNYTDAAKQALSVAMPHVRNALHVARRLAEAEGIRLQGLEALERTRRGVLLLAPSGRVVFLNREAERIARLDDGMCLREGQIVFADPRTAARAGELVARAAANGTGRALSAGRALLVNRPSGGLPYEVLVIPLSDGPGRHRLPVRTTVMMLISDPLEAFAIPFHKLVNDYGLTQAEARFCRALVTQGTLRRAADSTEVSINTGRSHLKKIFAKLGVQSQSQLFRLLGTGLSN